MMNSDPTEKKQSENNNKTTHPTENLDKFANTQSENDIPPIILVLCTVIPMILLIILFI